MLMSSGDDRLQKSADIHYQYIRDDLVEIKESIKSLGAKVDKVTLKIPLIDKHLEDEKENSRKVMAWASILATIVAAVFSLIPNFLKR